MQGGQAIMNPFIDGGALVLEDSPQSPEHALAGSIVMRHVGILVLCLWVCAPEQKCGDNVLQVFNRQGNQPNDAPVMYVRVCLKTQP